MADVFISHVEEDQDVALEISAGLEAAGLTTWCYEKHSLPGPSYLIQTGRAIDGCRAFLVVLSPAALGSSQIDTELVRAHESRKAFIPVLRDLSHAEFQARRPEWRQAIGGATSIVLPSGGVSAILPRLANGLQMLGVGGGAPQGSEPVSTRPVVSVPALPTKRGRPWLVRKAVVIPVAIVLAGVFGVFLLRPSTPTRPPDPPPASQSTPVEAAPSVITYTDGARYEGEVKDGAPSGRGVFTWADGTRLEGMFRDGLANGRGVSIGKDGSRHEGQYRNGKLNGRGIFIAKDGTRYEGEFRDGKFNGRGVYITKYGARYEGEFRDDNFNGRGVLTSPDGDRYEGEYRNGKLNGRGIFIAKNGTRYEGEFRDQTFNGRGVLTFPDGDRYEGEFRDTRFEGRGVLTTAGGDRYDGQFRANTPNGTGTLTLKSGEAYTGTWVNGCWRDGNRRMAFLAPKGQCE